MSRDGALVDGVLAVVLADGLEHVRQLEEAVRDAEEPRLAADVRQLRVGDDDLSLLEHAHVSEADLEGRFVNDICGVCVGGTHNLTKEREVAWIMYCN